MGTGRAREALAVGSRRLRPAALALGALALAALVRATAVQVGFWRDNRTLFAHALAVTAGNYQAHVALGIALSQEGLAEEAIVEYRAALALRPGLPAAQMNLCRELAVLGRLDEAARACRGAAQVEALRGDPNLAAAHNGLAMAFERAGRLRDAVGHYREALRLEPRSSEYHNNLGVALAGLGDLRGAAEQFARAVQLDPRNGSARGNLERARGRLERRLPHHERKIRCLRSIQSVRPEVSKGERDFLRSHYS